MRLHEFTVHCQLSSQEEPPKPKYDYALGRIAVDQVCFYYILLQALVSCTSLNNVSCDGNYHGSLAGQSSTRQYERNAIQRGLFALGFRVDNNQTCHDSYLTKHHL